MKDLHTGPAPGRDGSAMKKTVAAYVMDRSAKWLRAGDLMKLDTLYYAFSTVKEGKPGLYDLSDPALMAAVRKINPALKVILSVGGWGAGGFSEAAMTADGRALFTHSLMASIRAYDYDGVDMDWEYPCSDAGGIASHPDDKVNFTLLLASLREALDAYGQERGRPLRLSAALGAGASRVADLECDQVGRLLDDVNLMTYDMRGGEWSPAGHHTNLYPQTGGEAGMCADKAVKQYAEAGIPVEKMVLGAAFYGRVWHNTPGINQNGESGSTLRFTEIAQDCLPTEKRATGYTRYWDAQACAPYLYNGHDFISYDDEESLAHKCRYVAEKGLAGIMFWEYGGDRTGRLMKALTDAD